jgi:hypothetical protein
LRRKHLQLDQHPAVRHASRTVPGAESGEAGRDDEFAAWAARGGTAAFGELG